MVYSTWNLVRKKNRNYRPLFVTYWPVSQPSLQELKFIRITYDLSRGSTKRGPMVSNRGISIVNWHRQYERLCGREIYLAIKSYTLVLYGIWHQLVETTCCPKKRVIERSQRHSDSFAIVVFKEVRFQHNSAPNSNQKVRASHLIYYNLRILQAPNVHWINLTMFVSTFARLSLCLFECSFWDISVVFLYCIDPILPGRLRKTLNITWVSTKVWEKIQVSGSVTDINYSIPLKFGTLVASCLEWHEHYFYY